MSMCNIKKVITCLLLTVICSISHVVGQLPSVSLVNFEINHRDELKKLSSPEKDYVKFLDGHLFALSKSDWYKNGIDNLYEKRKEIKANAIVAEGTTVGVIWETRNQCDIFIHKNYSGKGYASAAWELYLNSSNTQGEDSYIHIRISPDNIGSLKSIAKALEKNKKVAEDDDIYSSVYGDETIKIDSKDLQMLANIAITIKNETPEPKEEGVNKIIDEKVQDSEKAKLFKLFYNVESVMIRVKRG